MNKAPIRRIAKLPVFDKEPTEIPLDKRYVETYNRRLKNQDKANNAVALASGISAIAQAFSPKMKGDVRTSDDELGAGKSVLKLNYNALTRMNAERDSMFDRNDRAVLDAEKRNREMSNQMKELEVGQTQKLNDAEFQAENNEFQAKNRMEIENARNKSRESIQKIRSTADVQKAKMKEADDSELSEAEAIRMGFSINLLEEFGAMDEAQLSEHYQLNLDGTRSPKTEKARLYELVKKDDDVNEYYMTIKAQEQAEKARIEQSKVEFHTEAKPVLTKIRNIINASRNGEYNELPKAELAKKLVELEKAWISTQSMIQAKGLEGQIPLSEEYISNDIASIKQLLEQRKAGTEPPKVPMQNAEQTSTMPLQPNGQPMVPQQNQSETESRGGLEDRFRSEEKSTLSSFTDPYRGHRGQGTDEPISPTLTKIEDQLRAVKHIAQRDPEKAQILKNGYMKEYDYLTNTPEGKIEVAKDELKYLMSIAGREVPKEMEQRKEFLINYIAEVERSKRIQDGANKFFASESPSQPINSNSK